MEASSEAGLGLEEAVMLWIDGKENYTCSVHVRACMCVFVRACMCVS